MYKVLKIGDIEYKLEYSFEAALYEDCTEAVINTINLMTSEDDWREMSKGISNIPNVTIILFYAGLLQYHGLDGDKTVKSIQDAKELAIKYIQSQEDGSFYGLMNECIEQMSEDGFFKLIGLNHVFGSPEEETTTAKTPQDHKPKQRSKKTAASEI